ncbi:MAG: phosphatidate cytidylyltransferase [Microthrixaceae bacterium]
MAGPEDDDPFASWFDESDTGALVTPDESGDLEDGFELPDWSAPPTGQVPAVVGSDQGPATGPVYRGESQTRGDNVPLAFDDLAETHLRVGALDDVALGFEGDPHAAEDYSVDAGDRPPLRPVNDDFEAGPSTEGVAAVPSRTAPPPQRRDAPPPPPGGQPSAPMAAPREQPQQGRPAGAPPPPGGGAPPGAGPPTGQRPQRRQPPPQGGAGARPRQRPPSAGGPPPEEGRARPTPRRSGSPADGESGERDLPQAVMVGVGLVVVGVAAFALGPIPAVLLILVVLGVAGTEMMGALHRGGYNPAGLVGLAGILGLVIGAYNVGTAAYPVVLGLAVMAGLLWYLVVAPGDNVVQNLGATMLGMLYVGGLGSFAALLIGLGRFSEDGKGGAWLLFGAVIAAVAYDTAGYFIGKTLGASPLGGSLRAVSPNKTQEGLMGGVVVSILATFVYLTVASPQLLGGEGFSTRTALFAVLCALAAPLGDLSESLLKRDLQIKDMGTLLPAHGGVLDRFDAMLFVLPVAYFVTTTSL